MDSGKGLSGGAVYAGNKKLSEKYSSKKGSNGQKRRDYYYENVLIGLWNSGEGLKKFNGEETELLKLLREGMKKFVEAKQKDINSVQDFFKIWYMSKGKDLASFVKKG
jgi:hypothetical protein